MTQGSTDKEIADALIEMQTAFPVTVHGPEGVHSSFGLTRREWLMAHAPVPQGLILSALGMDKWSKGLILSQDSSRAAFIALYATVAREMADAIIKEAARDG